MLRSHKTVQLTTIFNRKRETCNQARNRKLLTKSSLHNRIENVINIESNSLSEKQIDKHNKTFIHVYDIFILIENEIEIDRINLINIARKLRK